MKKNIENVSGTYKIVNSLAYSLSSIRGTGTKGYREAKQAVLMGMGFKYNKENKSLTQVEKSLPQLDKLFKLGTKGILQLQQQSRDLADWSGFPLKDNEKFKARIKAMTPEKKVKKGGSVRTTKQAAKIAKLEVLIAQLMEAK